MTLQPDGAYRTLSAEHAQNTLDFLATPLHESLIRSGRLVWTEIAGRNDDGDFVRLRHSRISFVSYPWEWSPSFWLAAAELSLDVCAEAVEQGWILKDATPLNVLFQGARPIFVDVPSLQPLRATCPLWFAYGQFVRTFLLPMIAHRQLGWTLNATMMRRDGFEPEELYRALSWRGKLSWPALSNVTLPALLAGKTGSFDTRLTKAASDRITDPEIATATIVGTLRKLRKQMRRTMPKSERSRWSAYVETATHYSVQEHAEKKLFVTEILASCQAHRVLDIGCNSGVYSMIAADTGAEVVAIDTDSEAVDHLARLTQLTGKDILPLCVDLAHPTPATGWENRETTSFLDRCYGHFDTVLMLAVIHHLLLSNQVPMQHIARLCGKITTAHLIVEWVPPTDVKFRQILRGREGIYFHITERLFRDSFAEYFVVCREQTFENGRTLLHMRKR